MLFKRKGNPPEQVRLRLGCLDTEPGGTIDQRPVAHVFVAEKPCWSEITDGLPQFATRP
jgi:hypothetical protein